MVICGKLQLDSSLSTALKFDDKCLKVHVEVNIKEKVERVFGTPTEKKFHILLHGKSYTKSYESTLLQKEYVVGDDNIVDDGDISFSVPLGKESQGWKPSRTGKVQHRQGHYRREGAFDVKYMVKLSITKLLSDATGTTSDTCHWSNAVELQFASNVDDDKSPTQDLLRVSVGAPAMIPQTKLFGSQPPTRFFSLVLSESKIQLCPNQQLTIELCQNPNEEQALVVDLEQVHVKFTQRNVCNGDSSDRHWVKTILPSKVNKNDTEAEHTLQGTVSVPGWLTPSYDGFIVQVVNEMIIYITNGKQTKDVIATSPKIIVQLNK